MKSFPDFTGKHLCWISLYIEQLEPAITETPFMLKRDPGTGVFQLNLGKFPK